jgi:hypothetical protein
MQRSTDHWPNYLPGPRDHLHALGVITLSYGHLENMFQILFSNVTGLNQYQVEALFQRIPNNVRSNIMLELLDKTTLPTNMKELVQYFSEAFRICAENRHGLMHSSSGGTVTGHDTGGYGFLFTKYSRAGNRMVCAPTLDELRAVADSMHDFMRFGGMLAGAVNTAGLLAFEGDSAWLPPSLDKPPLPTLLNWHAEADFRANLPPRGSSPA